MASFAVAALRIGQLATRLEMNASRLLKRTAQAVLRAVVETTPVDTGKAQANWLVGLDTPRREVVEVVAASSSIGEGSGLIAAARVGTTIIISNNVDYIKGLDDRDGFVSAAVDKGLDVIKGARVLR